MDSQSHTEFPHFKVAYGFAKTAETTFSVLTRRGLLRVTRDGIMIEGSSTSGQAVAIGGVVGGLIGGAIAAAVTSGSKDRAIRVDPVRSELVLDDNRQELSMLLPDGRWLAFRPAPGAFGRAPRQKFVELVGAMGDVFGPRMREGKLGAWGRRPRVLITIFVVCMLTAMTLILILAATSKPH